MIPRNRSSVSVFNAFLVYSVSSLCKTQKKRCTEVVCHYDHSDGFDRCCNYSRCRFLKLFQCFYFIILSLKAKDFLISEWQFVDE